MKRRGGKRRGAGSLAVDKLLRAFQDFWRRDGHLAAEGLAIARQARTSC